MNQTTAAHIEASRDSLKLVEIKDLVIELEGKLIVENISFDIHEGEIIALVGPNGAGKTTLIKAVMGLLPYRGEIHIYHRARFGLVPQAPEINRLFPIKVFELFLLFEKGIIFSPQHRQLVKIRRTLAKVGGENLFAFNLINLSMGELQKVLIALVLFKDPDVFFLDEPTSGLDVIARQMVFDEMHQLARDKKKAFVFVSHDIGAVYSFADKVVCLNKEQKCFGVPKRVLTPEVLLKTYGPEYALYFHVDHHTHHRR